MKKYYRNRVEIEDIDVDALWILEGDQLVLVDDDRYYAINLKENIYLFYDVPDPFKS